MNVNDVLHDRPVTPDEEDCCGNGCNPCIFDIHKQLLDDWMKKKSVQTTKRKNILTVLSYKIFHVETINKINNDYVIMYLRYKERYENDTAIFLNAGQHVVINLSTWSKPFTPIVWTDDRLKLLIRIYSNGINTKKLENIELDTEIKVRGPYGDFQYVRNSFKRIIMFGMGSGIAALYPIAKSIVDDENDETLIQFNLGFHSVNQVPLKEELKLLAAFWNFNCRLFIAEKEENEFEEINGVDITYERINENIFNSTVEKHLPETTLILICGNDKFNRLVEVWATKNQYIHFHVFK